MIQSTLVHGIPRARARRGLPTLFAVLLLAACGKGGTPSRGARDAGTDAGSPDASGDAGRCAIFCSVTCCVDGQECVVDRCLPECAGTRCGTNDDTCCAPSQLCLGGECVEPGAPCTRDGDCPTGEVCEPEVMRCLRIPPDAECNFVPEPGVIDPVVEWSWERETNPDGTEALVHVASVPLVLQTSDDDGNGVVDTRDVPDVIVASYQHAPTPSMPGRTQPARKRLTALSGDDGRVLWQTNPDTLGVDICLEYGELAGGDLDGDGEVEIVAPVGMPPVGCGGLTDGDFRVGAFTREGRLLWASDTTILRDGPGNRLALAIANLDGVGNPEIIAGPDVIDAEGNHLFTLSGFAAEIAVDVNGDEKMEIFGPATAYQFDGTPLWFDDTFTDARKQRGMVAIGRVFDGPGVPPGPQLVSIREDKLVVYAAATGAVVFGPLIFSMPGRGSGPLTIANMDEDPQHEIASVGNVNATVFDLMAGDPTRDYVQWESPHEDGTYGSTSATVFDFDGDGASEFVYSTECFLEILAGRDGRVLASVSNSSATIFEYPVVADVDGDGNAEIVMVSNAGYDTSITYGCDMRSRPHDGPRNGVRVFGDAADNWVPTRSVWNQHAFHIDNVGDDGRIPLREASGWDTHNTWRLSRDRTGDIFRAPNLRVGSLGAEVFQCPMALFLRARVTNAGARGVPAGVPVAFDAIRPDDTQVLIATGRTPRRLLSGESVWVEATARTVDLEPDLTLRFVAVADDRGDRTGLHSECREDDNASAPLRVDCSGPI
jgi:hypothetical protein